MEIEILDTEETGRTIYTAISLLCNGKRVSVLKTTIINYNPEDESYEYEVETPDDEANELTEEEEEAVIEYCEKQY
jgi:hypothetical protein